jgi:hypothetical protein
MSPVGYLQNLKLLHLIDNVINKITGLLIAVEQIVKFLVTLYLLTLIGLCHGCWAKKLSSDLVSRF